MDRSLFQAVYAQQQQQQQQQQFPYGVPPQMMAPQGIPMSPPLSASPYPPQPPSNQGYMPYYAQNPIPGPPMHAFPDPNLAANQTPGPVQQQQGGSNTPTDFYKGFYEGIVRHSGVNVGTAMSWVGPLVVNLALFVGPLWYFKRKFGSQVGAAVGAKGGAGAKDMMGSFADMFSPLKPKKYRVDVKGTTFADVIGIPEAKEEVKQYVDFLTDPAKYTRLGARLPKGCLLTGQPGTGKTLLARAIAGEAKTPFFSCSGADFIEVFGGSGPKRVRELFKEARAATPCVVFIDEIDAIGSRQGGRGMGGGSSEENRTINQLLAELDGLQSSDTMVVIAATNYPEAIDKALLRDGRFDRKVNIPMPDAAARKELFEFYLARIITGDPLCKPKVSPVFLKTDEKKAPNEQPVVQPPPVVIVPGVENAQFAKHLSDRTPGVTPAQIATIVNEAALAAACKDERVVTFPYLQEAIDDVLVGKKRRQRMGADALRRTALHECGHCLVAWLSPLQKDVIKISIIPRGQAGGYTQQVQDEAMEPKTDEFLFSQLCVLLGGRAAEKVFLVDVSTGALDDLQRATKLAMEKLLLYGMSKEIGNLAFRNNEKADGRAWMNYSENLHTRVEKEARSLVQRAFETALQTLESNRERFERLSSLLLDRRELAREDIQSVLGPRAVANTPSH